MSTPDLFTYGRIGIVALFLLFCLAASRRNSEPMTLPDHEPDDEDELPYQPPYMRRGGQ